MTTGTFVSRKFEPVKGLQILALTDPRLTERVRVLDLHCLPARYTDKYYDTYVKQGLHSYNQLAFFHDILIGSITCRLEGTEGGGNRLYIMTITVLEPYRRMSIGSRLLQKVLDNIHAEVRVAMECICLHVQVGSPAKAFYEGMGFVVDGEVSNYYPDLEIKDALIMKLAVPQPHLPKAAHGKKGGK